MICKYYVVSVMKNQQFSFGMTNMQDLGNDAVYVNMTDQNPSIFYFF
jgi:hypothetical protein